MANREGFPYTKPQPTSNGHHAAPPSTGGAFSDARAERTEFPRDQIPIALDSLLYLASRLHFGGMPLLRWPQWLCFFVIVIAALGLLPGQSWWIGGALLLWLGLQVIFHLRRRRDFVTFSERALPSVLPQPMPVSNKIPIFATGVFAVENKQQRYTWLPGFYRTFATREHALLCQVAAEPFWPICQWSEAEQGLWYIFFTPSAIDKIHVGTLAFGRHNRPALAIHYREPVVTTDKPRPPIMRIVYVACQQESDLHRILADLLVDGKPMSSQPVLDQSA